jgi:hypothetical protein
MARYRPTDAPRLIQPKTSVLARIAHGMAGTPCQTARYFQTYGPCYYGTKGMCHCMHGPRDGGHSMSHGPAREVLVALAPCVLCCLDGHCGWLCGSELLGFRRFEGSSLGEQGQGRAQCYVSWSAWAGKRYVLSVKECMRREGVRATCHGDQGQGGIICYVSWSARARQVDCLF